MSARNLLILCLCVLSLPVRAATLLVTSTADSVAADGNCTLREAIQAMNAGAAVNECAPVTGVFGTSDTIQFNIPAATDPGCNAGTLVCTLLPVSPLPVVSAHSVIIDGTTQPGFAANTNAGTLYPNAEAINASPKIELDGQNAGAGVDGLELSGNGNRVQGLSIVNFASAGINAPGNYTQILGNFLGVRADGITPAGNNVGVVITGRDTQVGHFSTAQWRNLISSNSLYNVAVGPSSQGIVVHGNLIGTDRSGSAAFSVGQNGLITEGSLDEYRGNVIGGLPLNGVVLRGAQNITVAGNAIGIGVGGVALTNGGSGIFITRPAGTLSSSHSIERNGIANNMGDGIEVVDGPGGSPGLLNLHANSIWNNGSLGINLRPSGEVLDTVTANDPAGNLDADAGPNGLQNFPVITAATVNGTGGVDIVFTLDSAANTNYAISTYASASCDGSGHGEGQYWSGISSGSVATDVAGHAAGTISLATMPANWAVGMYVTLLAHRTGGNYETSEFSACMQIAGAVGLPSLAISDVTAVEGNAGTTAFNFTVSLDMVPTAPVSVDWGTSSGTAAPSGDYTGGTGTLSWSAGDTTSRTVTILVNGDTTIESDETFSVVLQNASGATVGDGTGVGTILNDDTPGTAPLITSGTPPGGTQGVPYSFQVTATGTAPVTFSATGLPAGLAIDSGTGLISGTPTTWTPGPVTVTITAANGVLPNATQTFAMTILPQPVATGTLGFSAATYSVGEAAGAATITVSRTGGSSGAVSVEYLTENGTASAGQDYLARSGTFTWADGDATDRTFSIPIINDAAAEPAETVLLRLQNVAGGSVMTQSSATLTLVDDDPTSTAPLITSGTPPGGTQGVPYSFQVTASGTTPITFNAAGLPAGLAIDVNTGLISGTPTTWTPGPVTVTLTAANGVLPNATQTFAMAILPQAVAGDVTPVPTLSELGLLLMGVLVAGASLIGFGRGAIGR